MSIPTSGQIVDATTYRKGIGNMKPGAHFEPTFVARRAGRVKKKELLCTVLSMPTWYGMVQAVSNLQKRLAELHKTLHEVASERDKLRRELHDLRAHMLQAAHKASQVLDSE